MHPQIITMRSGKTYAGLKSLISFIEDEFNNTTGLRMAEIGSYAGEST